MADRSPKQPCVYTLAIILLGILPPAVFLAMGRMLDRKGDLHPFTVMGWTLFIGYTIKSLYLAYAVNTGAPFRTDFLSADIIHIGQLAICIGLFGFVAGYMILQGTWSGQPFARPRANFLGSPEYLYYPVFFLSVLLMMVYFYQMGFLTQLLTLRFEATKFYYDDEGVRSSLAFLTIGGDLILVYFVYWLTFTKRLTLANIYVPAIGLISLAYMLASRRNGVLLIIASVIMVYGVRTAREKYSAKIQRNAMIAVIFILLAFVSAIRQGGGEKELSDLNLSGAIASATEHTFEGAYFLDPAKTAAIIRQTNNRNLFLYGQSFTGAFFAPVPRVLWPEKPNVRIGPYVAQEVLDYDNNTGVPPGAIGEFYMNFGWAGVLFGMLGLGLMTAWLHNRYRVSTDRRFSRPAYALMYLCIILFLFADFSLFILYMIRYGLGIFLCVLFWQKMVALDAQRVAHRRAIEWERQRAVAAALPAE
jgi:oligosaccharide repeat unit polymerase